MNQFCRSISTSTTISTPLSYFTTRAVKTRNDHIYLIRNVHKGSPSRKAATNIDRKDLKSKTSIHDGISRWTRELKRISSNHKTKLQIVSALAFFYHFCLTDENGEYRIAFCSMAGPSMLPTIYPSGDSYMVDLFTHKLPEEMGRREFRRGDIVVFFDWKGDCCSKRIVGVEGDVIPVNGEFASTLFNHRKDLGLRNVERSDVPIPPWKNDLQLIRSADMRDDLIVVPDGHVWVEGDNPLFSTDSRHYGPIKLRDLKGRLVTRYWPLMRKSSIYVADSADMGISTRPKPMTEKELAEEWHVSISED